MNQGIAPPSSAADEFDAVAADYAGQLAAGLSLTGEDMSYYARSRAQWVARRLAALGHAAATVLDFGCGTGTATPFLLEAIGAERVIGVDVSVESIRIARQRFPGPRTSFASTCDGAAAGTVDLAFCNGVFHHIPPAERLASATFVYQTLRAGGLFAFWENNPWNPGTRMVMRRIPFDRDAITLTPPESKSLLTRAGFQVVGTDFLFLFPSMLRWLRWVEPMLWALPLGGQYCVLCRKPA